MGLQDKTGKLIVPRASDFQKADDFFNHIANSREGCGDRGYHRVSQDDKDPLICYDCDLWFGKGDAEGMGIEYRVEDPFKA